MDPHNARKAVSVHDADMTESSSPTNLAFATADIASVRASAPEYGRAVQPQGREWDFDGARMCDGNDPEGNVFQLREARVDEAPTTRQ